jgi:hypothetical protein
VALDLDVAVAASQVPLLFCEDCLFVGQDYALFAGAGGFSVRRSNKPQVSRKSRAGARYDCP